MLLTYTANKIDQIEKYVWCIVNKLAKQLKAEQKSITGGGDSTCYSGPFLVDTFGHCYYRINGNDFQGVVVNGCCC